MSKLMNDGHGKVKVVDENGRKGTATYHGGYLMGGAYVNPHWTIRWNKEETRKNPKGHQHK